MVKCLPPRHEDLNPHRKLGPIVCTWNTVMAKKRRDREQEAHRTASFAYVAKLQANERPEVEET